MRATASASPSASTSQPVRRGSRCPEYIGTPPLMLRHPARAAHMRPLTLALRTLRLDRQRRDALVLLVWLRKIELGHLFRRTPEIMVVWATPTHPSKKFMFVLIPGASFRAVITVSPYERLYTRASFPFRKQMTQLIHEYIQGEDILDVSRLSSRYALFSLNNPPDKLPSPIAPHAQARETLATRETHVFWKRDATLHVLVFLPPVRADTSRVVAVQLARWDSLALILRTFAGGWHIDNILAVFNVQYVPVHLLLLNLKIGEDAALLDVVHKYRWQMRTPAKSSWSGLHVLMRRDTP
ncbi:hypothetical protein C8R45DRAFT_1188759 [Mycena sanguinolenta]|nr:hypothetical protein C8R45DRAFT_1188759 [Mycena sanguinolenta]